MEKKLPNILFYLTATLCLFSIINFLLNPIVSDDTGFYLAVAKEFYSGKVYFHEIGITYNPLSIIAVGIPFLFDNNPNYIWHLLINILVIICSSIILYKISNKILTNKKYSLFFASFFVLVCLILDGRFIMLEPLSIFFQLLALYIYFVFNDTKKLKYLLLVGLFTSLSFLSKQYGLFILLPIVFDVLVKRELFFKKLSFLAIGGFFPLILFYLYLNAYGVNTTQFIAFILGKGFELDYGIGTALNTNILTYPIDLLYVILFNLYIFIIPIYFFKYFQQLDSNKYLIISSFLASTLILYFASYWHYFQYLIPYLIILFIYLFQSVDIIRYKKFGLLLFFISIVFISGYSISSYNSNITTLNDQKKEQLILNKFIPEGAQVFLHGPSPAYYYLCNLKSINLRYVGYEFPGYLFPETIVKNLNSGAYIVTNTKSFKLYEKIVSNFILKTITIDNKEYIIIQKPQ